MWKHKTKWLVRGGRKVRCYLCGKKILSKDDLFLFHGDTGYYSHQSCQAESTTISGNERRRAVKKIAVGAAVVGAIAAGAGKFLDVSSQSKNSPAAQTILTSQGLIPPALTSDPANPVAGQMWYRSDKGVTAHFDAIENRVIYSNRIVDGSAVVSSKGIVNGLSVLPNDGQDWGSDTTLGATAPGQYGSPYTKTSGWQEAYNSLPLQYSPEFSVNVPVGHIKILNGVYNWTNTMFINPMSIVSFIGENAGTTIFGGGRPSTQTGVYINSTGQYGAISVTTNSPSQLIGRIKLENLYVQYTLPSGQTYIDSTADGGGGAIISTPSFNENIMIDVRVGTQSLINNQPVISGGNGSDNMFYIDRVFTHAPSSMVHFQSGSNHLHIGFIAMFSDPDNGPVNGFSSTTNNGLIQLGGGMNFFIDQVHIFGTVYNILYVEAENDNNSSPTRLSSLLINSIYLEIGTPSQTTGYYAFSIYKNVIIQSFQFNGASYNPLTDATNNFVLPMTILSTGNTASVPAPTLSTNPPVSGTAYQNTNPYDIRLKIPVTYSPTSTAAATLATGTSSTSTVTTSTKVSYPAGITTGIIETYEMVVKAGQYFELVVTNATIGTVEVQAA